MIKKTVYLSLILLLVFCADISQFFLFTTIYVYLLLCLYWAVFFYTTNTRMLFLAMLLLSLEYFCCYGQFGLPLLYLIPISMIGFLVRQNLYQTLLQPPILLSLCVIAQIYGIEAYWLGITHTTYYTIGKISVNIIVISYFSLTLKYWDKLGNRL